MLTSCWNSAPLFAASISVAMSRKGPWRLARTLATQTGMTNKWLKAQGLCLSRQWVNIYYPVKPGNLRDSPGADPMPDARGGWEKKSRLPDQAPLAY